MTIRVGTASWTDKTLLACGRFYPPAVRDDAAGRLRYYAARFPLAEIDASYYALPDPRQAQAWAERTPADFVFNIKSFRLFTGHQTPLRALDPDLRRELPPADPETVVYADGLPAELREEAWRRFLIALDPLRMSGKLGAVHFQFPPWIQPDRRGMMRVRDCVEHLDEDLVAAVELRHASWYDGAAAQASTLDFLRALGAAHTVADMPQGYDNTVPALWQATRQDLAVVRLHGRNAAAWNSRGAASSSRFQYEYTPEELAELARQVRELARRVRETHVVLNTNFEDQGMRNAQGLIAALQTVA
ncbi:DUF72 domain-containing protein [Achromobacter aloeverae]|uniref:DUF72 domain-containing protein n=1 Tax=Achromobacter aloeverae TaxID=1750518 RepID=A0A4Q1HQ75_9BURK|nr:DUF72 domain-containing protein [Achromobacter aloeverae]RXN93234.1 DUF72 domain-containing protein [Achromobacter aloeverae]